VDERSGAVAAPDVAIQPDRAPRPVPADGWLAFDRFVGRSPAMERVYALLERVAPTDVPVLLVGESGTGKELAARTLHELSPRRNAPFLAVNAGAIPSTMVESEMFGHERGSFTGAVQKHLGYFERARGGTLLLDEITEMPIDLQVKLLRVLESDTLQRVGGERDIPLDVRVVAATNSDPEAAIAEGRLREDLFFRLCVFRIDLPPLRERGSDIELLARHFLDLLNERGGTSKRLALDALAPLDGYAWPGNVRELRNLVHASYLLSDDDRVRLRGSAASRPLPAAAGPPDAFRAPGSELVGIPIGTTAEEAERRLILATLERCRGNKNEAARILGLSLKTVYNRLKAYRSMQNGAAAHTNGSVTSC
jgi:DNA-binding NtrC family response regulator